ncbi:hypothetical protein ACOR62_03700 [Neisseria lisongii]|nr:hypothetical protein [Neisseria lisongii]
MGNPAFPPYSPNHFAAVLSSAAIGSGCPPYFKEIADKPPDAV